MSTPRLYVLGLLVSMIYMGGRVFKK